MHVHIKLLLTYPFLCRSSVFFFFLDCWYSANVTEGTAVFVLHFSLASKREKGPQTSQNEYAVTASGSQPKIQISAPRE